MLSDKIWVTRKARIYTEQRLLNSNSISNFLIVWYSLILVFLTIWNLEYPNEYINIFLVFGSIALLIASTVVTSQKYLERSLAVRNCYVKLDELYSKVIIAEQKENVDQIQELKTEYSAIIQNVENHSDYDYLCLRFSLRNNKKTTLPEFNWVNCLIYIFNKIWRYLITFLYFVLPFGLAYIWGLI